MTRHDQFGAGCTGCDWISDDVTKSLAQDHAAHVASLARRRHVIRYIPGTHLADKWGDGPCGSFGTREEEWREIPGFPAGYQVSSFGRVRSFLKSPEGRELAQRKDKDGYLLTHLSATKGASVPQRVHRLVLLAFIGPPPSGRPITRHLDGDPSNNRVDNLTWGTQAENMRDTVAHGNHPFASRTHCVAGHEYTEANTRWRIKASSGRPGRICRACCRIRAGRPVDVA